MHDVVPYKPFFPHLSTLLEFGAAGVCALCELFKFICNGPVMLVVTMTLFIHFDQAKAARPISKAMSSQPLAYGRDASRLYFILGRENKLVHPNPHLVRGLYLLSATCSGSVPAVHPAGHHGHSHCQGKNII